MDRRSFLKRGGLVALALSLNPKSLFADTPEINEKSSTENPVYEWSKTTTVKNPDEENAFSRGASEIIFAEKNDIIADTFTAPVAGYYLIHAQIITRGRSETTKFMARRIT